MRSAIAKSMPLKDTINAIVRAGDRGGYVAECLEISVVTQGDTLDEIVAHLQEAVSLHLEGEDPAEFGLIPHPSLVVTFRTIASRSLPLPHPNLSSSKQHLHRKSICVHLIYLWLHYLWFPLHKLGARFSQNRDRK